MQAVNEITMVYDGACPICNLGAHKFMPDPSRFTLKLVNARNHEDPELMQRIQQEGYNLNKGLVVAYKGKLYHGRKAMQFCAARSQNATWLDKILAHDLTSRVLYPLFVRIRGISVRLNGANQIQQ